MLIERTGTYRALDHVFAVEVRDIPGTAAHLDGLLAPLAHDGRPRTTYVVEYDAGASDGRAYTVHVDADSIDRTLGLSHALALVFWHVNQEAVRRSTQRYVLVHAAAAERDGVAVVLPAPMESGKTTTVAGLLLTGYRYYTDEAVALRRDDGWIEPFPKPLSIDEGSWETLRRLEPREAQQVLHQWLVPVTRIPGSGVAAPLPPRLIVAPSYRAGSKTELTAVSRTTMLAELMASTFHVAPSAGRQLEVLRRAVAGSDCFHLKVGSLDAAVRLIDALVEDVLTSQPSGQDPYSTEGPDDSRPALP